MPTQTVQFTNRGGDTLSGRIDLPSGASPRLYCLFAHCFTCSKQLNAVRTIVRGLTEQNIAVFSFDFTGLGSSSGEFAKSTFSHQISDLIDAATYMKDTLNAPPRIMIGHSLGGTASLYAAQSIESVNGVATIGSPADPEHVTKLFGDGIKNIEQQGYGTVSIGGRPFTIDKQFVEDLRNHPPEQWLGKLKKDTIIFHSPVDTIVSIDNAETIFRALRHPKSFVSLNKADHLLTNPADAKFVAASIAGWTNRCEATQAEQAKPLATNSQVAVRIGTQPYTSEIVAGHHRMIADEPASYNGSDLGASPFSYLLASLGGCTVITLKMYAERNKYPLKEVVAHLDFTAAKAGNPATIARSIEISGDLNDDQRQRLMAIADRCPVHRVLSNVIDIKTSPHA